MKIYNVCDEEFKAYGRVIEGIDFTEIIRGMDLTPLPEDVVYEPSDKGLEKTSALSVISNKLYGQMDVQIGYCNGHNHKLNALEYHRSSEINVAATDMILLLGRQQDISKDYIYDTSKVEAFFVPKNTAVEIYATTLHYAPCGVDGSGFKCTVILPRGTNYPLENDNFDNNYSEDKLLQATNKWLIAHPDAKIEGAFEGLVGENITI